MNAIDTRIRELVDYVRVHGDEDRTALYRNLIDLFLTGKAPVKQPTRAQLLDVVEALLPHVDRDSRQTAADLLAGLSDPPMDLVMRLSRDEAALVRNLLHRAPYDEDDLIALITRTGRGHHSELATRNDLSANVWIALARARPADDRHDGPSSFSFWRDTPDGAGKDKGGATVTPLPTTGTDPEGSRSQEDSKEQTEDRAPDHTAHPPKSDTGSDTGSETGDTAGDHRAASLRILRRDEDLLVEHFPENKVSTDINSPEAADQYGTPAEISGEDTGTQTADISPAPGDGGAPANEAPQTAHRRHDTRHQAGGTMGDEQSGTRTGPDTEPAGWSWSSDRDGFVTSVSAQAHLLFDKDSDGLVGMAMLDLLALNNKLGHPITRALQRRTPIHDAPIYLSHLPKGHRYWTLEATPRFSPAGGLFEGYDGHLTPVVPGALENDLLAAGGQTGTVSGETTRRATVSGMAGDGAGHEGGDEDDGDDLFLPETPAGGSDTPRPTLRDLTAPKQSAPPVAPVPADAGPGTPRTADQGHDDAMRKTLDVLETAVSQLLEHGRASGNIDTRLQAEIAAACVRTLKDQVG